MNIQKHICNGKGKLQWLALLALLYSFLSFSGYPGAQTEASSPVSHTEVPVTAKATHTKGVSYSRVLKLLKKSQVSIALHDKTAWRLTDFHNIVVRTKLRAQDREEIPRVLLYYHPRISLSSSIEEDAFIS